MILEDRTVFSTTNIATGELEKFITLPSAKERLDALKEEQPENASAYDQELVRLDEVKAEMKAKIRKMAHVGPRSSAFNDALPIGDQLDAIWKFIIKEQLNGVELPEDTAKVAQLIQETKRRIPKAE